MKQIATLGWFVTALLLIGCSPAVSLRPLQDAKDHPAAEPQVEGQWILPNLGNDTDRGEITLQISRRGDGYSVIIRSKPEQNSDKQTETVDDYQVLLTTMQDKLFFDAELSERTADGHTTSEQELEIGTVAIHYVGRAWVHPDYLRIAMLDSDWVKEHTPEESREMVRSTAVITVSKDALGKFLLQNANDVRAFSYYTYFCREGKDCAREVAEDSVRQAPDDTHMLDDIADFFMAEKDYTKAVGLLRHSADLQPQDPGAKVHLGNALILARDFEGARREFAAAQKLQPENPQRQEDIGWTYFIEGKFEEAAKAFHQCLSSGKNESADPILLEYFSLLRLGRQKQAEKLLAEQTEKFSGFMQEHLLLLRAEGRTSEGPLPPPEENQNARFYFFEGLSRISKGQFAEGRRSLQKAESSSKKSFFSLAARPELDRLPSNIQTELKPH